MPTSARRSERILRAGSLPSPAARAHPEYHAGAIDIPPCRGVRLPNPGPYTSHLYNNCVAHQVTLIPGDGIGPEVAEATVRAVDATGVEIEWERVEAGLSALHDYGELLPE